MSTLLLRLIGPMQSWGIDSHFTIRDTGREPSKSGVVGLLCAALGRPRSASLDDLAVLKMGVRVDREGVVKSEFQVAQDIYTAKGKIKNSVTSFRFYLSDAAFLVGLEGEDVLLTKIQNALQNPRWTLFLGRKAFVPAIPPWLPDGLKKEERVYDALKNYPPLIEGHINPLRIVIEDPQGEQEQQDVPVSFAERQFLTRRVQTSFLEIPPVIPGVF